MPSSTVSPSQSKSSFSGAVNKHALTCDFPPFIMYNLLCIFWTKYAKTTHIVQVVAGLLLSRGLRRRLVFVLIPSASLASIRPRIWRERESGNYTGRFSVALWNVDCIDAQIVTVRH